MPARKRRILVNDNGESIKRAVGHKPEYWSVETDDRFSVFITTDGGSWAIIEGSTAVLIPDDIMTLICDTKQMHDKITAEGRTLIANKGPTETRAKNERKPRQRLDLGKVVALANGGWTVDEILDECEMDGVKTTREQIERIVRYGRD